MNFAAITCPLCQFKLQHGSIAGFYFAFCPTTIDEDCHYTVQFTGIQKQRIIIPPYSIDSLTDPPKSRIYKMVGQDKWELIKETPLIQAESAEKMLERLQTLLLFL